MLWPNTTDSFAAQKLWSDFVRFSWIVFVFRMQVISPEYDYCYFYLATY